jgi:plastocyanin
MRASRTIALAIATALFSVSCGGGGGYGTPTTPSTPSTPPSGGAGTVTITITGQGGKLAFTPNPATVTAGQTVAFKNMDTVPHRVLLDDGNTQTADIAPGATSAAVTIGTNKSYHCVIHPGMVGGFNGTEVEPPPNCNMAYCGG